MGCPADHEIDQIKKLGLHAADRGRGARRDKRCRAMLGD
jgi:hypothetical protein